LKWTMYQFALRIPLLQNVANFLVAEAHLSHDAPGFADSTHHAVLDAIVYHLDVVTCAAPPNDAHAWLALLIFCCDLLKKWQNLSKPSLVATRAHGRSSSSCLVAATHTAANIVYSCASALVLSTFRILEVFIAAVEDDVSL
jgi:hypothetical protein